MMEKKSQLFSTLNLTLMAVLTAVACLLDLIPGIPIVGFYKLDFSLLPVLLGTFSIGPAGGTVILLLKCLIGWAHSTTMGIGKLADFIMGLAMILPAGLIYARNKTRKTAIIGMTAGTVCMIVIGILANKYILFPFYIGSMPYINSMEDILHAIKLDVIDSEWKLLLLITGPFNLLKGIVLSVVTGVIYKPLSPLLHGKRRN